MPGIDATHLRATGEKKNEFIKIEDGFGMHACISRRRNVLQSGSGFISVKLPRVQHFLLLVIMATIVQRIAIKDYRRKQGKIFNFSRENWASLSNCGSNLPKT